MHSHLDSVLFHESTILSRLDEMARDITRDYVGKDLTVLLILHGGIFFAADLLRRIHCPLRLTSLEVASYHGGTGPAGELVFSRNGLPAIDGQHVLIVDDILDTGQTLATIRQRIQAESAPASVRLCVLLRKQRSRAIPVSPDYVGFDIADEFVVGYGLDYHGHYRNLPLIGTLKREFIHPGA
jgi:hypoxanthine phosphoribosyltransferase